MTIETALVLADDIKVTVGLSIKKLFIIKTIPKTSGRSHDS